MVVSRATPVAAEVVDERVGGVCLVEAPIPQQLLTTAVSKVREVLDGYGLAGDRVARPDNSTKAALADAPRRRAPCADVAQRGEEAADPAPSLPAGSRN
nr:unnamed protein product [Digitaria exilis]